jgi:hypothetical protein
MDDTDELLRIFSTPRPNGSSGARQTSLFIQQWLHSHDIPFLVHTYTQYPYFFEANGIWMILTRSLLALSAWLNWGWWTPVIAIAGMLGGTLDSALHLPLVTWPGKRTAENILIDLWLNAVEALPPIDCEANHAAPLNEKHPATMAARLSFAPLAPANSSPAPRDIILSAHYDSKTELLDHRQRMFFLRSIPAGMLITVLVGVAGALQAAWASNLSWTTGWSSLVYWGGSLLSLPLAFLALGYGLNLTLGRLIEPSPGAVDNGAACVILLRLAEKLKKQSLDQRGSNSSIPTPTSHITIALFSGEEIDRQGSRAYVRAHPWNGNEIVLNLEAMAQDGNYVTWQRDGSIFRLRPTDSHVEEVIHCAVKRITGNDAVSGGPVLSDAAPFIEKGLPSAVLGTYDKHWKDKGFHRPSDNLKRVVVDRIEEGVEILIQFIREIEGK